MCSKRDKITYSAKLFFKDQKLNLFLVYFNLSYNN